MVMQQEVVGVILAISFSIAYCCVFPKYLQSTTWFKNNRGSTRTAVYFRESIMESQLENMEYNYISDEWEDTCRQQIDTNTFIISHENETFSCMVFVERSKSIVQLKVSSTSQKFSQNLCEHDALYFDKWLLVSFEKSLSEFTLCPISGGYNMKIKDKNQIDHPCNFMDLPMRFESECHTGEGITFDFRTKSCKGNIPMNQVQKFICVTSWRQDGDVLSILRNPESGKLWCLRIPARRTFDGKTVMILFVDLTCSKDETVEYYTLELELVSQNSLCTDEHNGCHRLPCTDYFVSQCLKSCGKCDPNVYPTACTYPRRIRGMWFMNDAFGSDVINVSGSILDYKRVGLFSCVTFPGSPPSRKTKQFTSVSYFNNGCRPRYTCISYKRMNSNVFGFALSQSKVWPLPKGHDGVWTNICSSSNFYGDPNPIGDTFRTYNDVFKPMTTKHLSTTDNACNLHSSYLFNATFRTGGICAGRLFKVCQNTSHLRIEYDNCPFTDYRVQNFVCLGLIDSKYWENIILLQSTLDFRDTSCLILSDIERGRALMLPSGECDQFTWTYVNVGLRHSTLDMIITPEVQSCRFLESTTVAISHTSTTKAAEPLQDAFLSDNVPDSHDDATNQSAKTIHKTTHKYRHHAKVHPIKTSTTPLYQYKVVSNDRIDKMNPSSSAVDHPVWYLVTTVIIIFQRCRFK